MEILTSKFFLTPEGFGRINELAFRHGACVMEGAKSIAGRQK